MLTRRALVVAGIILTATGLPACSRGVTATWRGRTIEVVGADGVSLNADGEQAEVAWDRHRIVIRETEITMNGETRKVQPFKRVVITVKSDTVTVAVDGAPLFP